MGQLFCYTSQPLVSCYPVRAGRILSITTITNNIDRTRKHSIPLTISWPIFPLNGKCRDFVDWVNFVQSINYYYFYFIKVLWREINRDKCTDVLPPLLFKPPYTVCMKCRQKVPFLKKTTGFCQCTRSYYYMVSGHHQRIYINLRMDSSRPSSYIEMPHPTSPRSVCSPVYIRLGQIVTKIGNWENKSL